MAAHRDMAADGDTDAPALPDLPGSADRDAPALPDLPGSADPDTPASAALDASVLADPAAPGVGVPVSPLLTVGHGTADRERLAGLLLGARVAAVVDVRTAPGSRRNPDVGRERLREWLPEDGIGYRWEKDLGGFRRAEPDAPDVVWRNESFRGYAGYTRDPRFTAAVDRLLPEAAARRTAVMCSESVWWRCHRRIIADFVVLARGVPVRHLMPDGRLAEHRPTPGVRLREDGLLVYDDTAAADAAAR